MAATTVPADLAELRILAAQQGKPEARAFVAAFLSGRYATGPTGQQVLARVFGTETIEAIVEWLWSAEGPLAAAGYEPRQGQRALALMASRSTGGGWGIAEAPTGSGKGLSYLAPGILAALRAERDYLAGRLYASDEGAPRVRRKLLVSTANIALQEQLMKKDIPGLERALQVSVRSSLLKGRNNYLCRDALGDVELVKSASSAALQKYRDWADQPGATGDREAAPFDVSRDWHVVSRGSDECTREACKFHGVEGGCFADVARASVEAAHVVVTNHAYLARMIFTKAKVPAVLLAVDEAHQLEDYLRKALATQVTKGAGRDAVRLLDRYGEREHGVALVTTPIERLNSRAESFLEKATRPGAYPNPTALRPGWASGEEGAPELLRRAADRVARLPISEPAERMRQQNAVDRLASLAEDVDSLIAAKPLPALLGRSAGRWALWVEGDRDYRRVTLQLAPASVTVATEALARAYPGAVLVSATLAVDGGFDDLLRALGVDLRPMRGPDEPENPVKVRERQVLPSPYDLPRMGVLVVPRGPTPKEGGWEEWADEQVVETVVQARGRTLVLCSSKKSMEARYGALTRDPRSAAYPTRMQGQAGRAELRTWFKECVEGVLVATRSFFEGLDVQGEACSCVVIDKMPFAVPGDPLEDKVCEEIVDRAGGGSAFNLRGIPKAAEALAQASGRLIRSQTDRGAIVMLDNRVNLGWARAVRRALPPFPQSADLCDVARAIDGEPLSAVQAPLFAGGGSTSTGGGLRRAGR